MKPVKSSMNPKRRGPIIFLHHKQTLDSGIEQKWAILLVILLGLFITVVFEYLIYTFYIR